MLKALSEKPDVCDKTAPQLRGGRRAGGPQLLVLGFHRGTWARAPSLSATTQHHAVALPAGLPAAPAPPDSLKPQGLCTG